MSPTKLNSMSYGDYAKELEELKKLLQKTSEEMKACCSDQHAQDRSCEESDQACQETLNDVKEGLFDISKEIEESLLKDRASGITELRQAVEANNREFLASIREAAEGQTRAIRKGDSTD